MDFLIRTRPFIYSRTIFKRNISLGMIRRRVVLTPAYQSFHASDRKSGPEKTYSHWTTVLFKSFCDWTVSTNDDMDCRYTTWFEYCVIFFIKNAAITHWLAKDACAFVWLFGTVNGNKQCQCNNMQVMARKWGHEFPDLYLYFIGNFVRTHLPCVLCECKCAPEQRFQCTIFPNNENKYFQYFSCISLEIYTINLSEQSVHFIQLTYVAAVIEIVY